MPVLGHGHRRVQPIKRSDYRKADGRIGCGIGSAPIDWVLGAVDARSRASLARFGRV
jgi:hypothetical protein